MSDYNCVDIIREPRSVHGRNRFSRDRQKRNTDHQCQYRLSRSAENNPTLNPGTDNQERHAIVAHPHPDLNHGLAWAERIPRTSRRECLWVHKEFYDRVGKRLRHVNDLVVVVQK
jgi:hypothetical protein